MSRAGARVLVDVGDFDDAPTRLVERAARGILAAEGREDVEVSVALLADEDMRELNRRYLGKDVPTDVIAFALGEGGDLVGDVYVGVEQARRQAEELGLAVEEELARLVIHGVLHVLGHDHPEGPERLRSHMFFLQERVLREVLGGRPDA
jgi:rRNA maturation RNase YbeY